MLTRAPACLPALRSGVKDCGECVEKLDVCTECKEGFHLSPDGLSCEQCRDPACMWCTDNVGTCTTCREGFGLVGGSCVICEGAVCCEGRVASSGGVAVVSAVRAWLCPPRLPVI